MKSIKAWPAPARGAFLLFAVVMLPAARPSIATAQAPAPPAYQDMYTSLNAYLDSFNAILNASWNGTKYPVLFTGELAAANANAGASLVNPTVLSTVQMQLQEMKAMGIQAVIVNVNFPMLYQPFFSSESQYEQFVSFYAQVAAMIRAQGLKLIVENQALLSNSVQAGWNTTAFYASLDWDQYQAARAQTAVIVAQTMRPDYLGVLQEPDTEAAQSGQSNVNTVSGATSLLSGILTNLQQAGVPGVKVGAGVGTWLYNYQQFMQSFVALPIDFVDMHIFPVNYGYLPNALTVASMAAAAGKPVSVGQAWMHKNRDSELNVLTADQIQARNPFSFWAPLDAYFVQTMENLANYTQMAFMAPFGTQYFFAYQDYDTAQYLSPGDIQTEETTLALQANMVASYSSTGMSFYSSNMSTADVTPPSTPTNLSGVSGSSTGTWLNWTASTDDVGVAGYYVFRNGQNVGTTSQPYYQDLNLTSATTYSYMVEAFDLGGNLSSPSQTVNVATLDPTPPGAPGSLVATPLTTSQISVAWTAAVDNVGISSYRIFQGSTPTTLSQIATLPGTTTSFTNYSLTPGNTYFYAVQAVDTSGNVGLMSTIVSASTLAPPSPPTSLTATVVSSTQISLVWVAGSSGMPIGSYRIFRGTTPSSMVQVATRSTAAYSDVSLSPSTTYYYMVQETDTVGNISPPSNTASGTTFSLPDPPANVVATSTSTKQVGLTWVAGAGSLSVKNYRVFRGSSGTNLSQVATVTNTAYTDVNVTPATTYYYGVEQVDTSNAASNMSQIVSVTTLVLPSPPTSVTATATSPKQIVVSWTPGSSGMAIASYRVFRGTSQSNMAQIATIGKTTYTDGSVMASTTYCYGVQEVDSGGNISDMSNASCATTLALPQAPLNLTATPVSTKQINLSWSPGPSGLAVGSYKLYRGTTSSNLTLLVTTTKLTYSNTSLNASTTYYYAIQETDTAGDVSPMGGTIAATTLGLPQVPTGVAATPTANKQITVVWTPGPSGLPVGSYKVFRGATQSTLAQVAAVAVTSYVDKNVGVGSTYYYAVEEMDTGGNVSPMSTIIPGTTWGPPSAPVNVTLTIVSTKEIDVSWVAGSSNLAITSYKVFRGTIASSLSQVGTATTPVYKDKALSAATTYYYAVEEVDSGGNVSAMSSTVSGATLALPSPPTNVGATAVSKTQVSVTWSAAQSGMPLASYRLCRGNDALNLVQIKSISPTQTYATDYPVTAGTTYYYAVQSTDSGGNVSALSTVVQVTTPH